MTVGFNKRWESVSFFACFSLLLLPISGVVARDKPYMNVTRFDTTVSERTNVCDRQKLLYQGNSSVARALEGLNLTVAITRYTEPYEDRFFNLDEDGYIPEDNPGLFVIILDELARRAGFNWRDSFVAIEAVDMTKDGQNRTQSELLEWQVKSFDLSVDNWSKTVSRMRLGIAFPEGWYDSSLVLIERVEPDSGDADMWSFLTPFTLGVWIMIGVSILVTGVMYWILERLNAKADNDNLEDKPVASIFLSAMAFTGNFDYQPNTHSARMLSLSWSFWALLVTAAYTANLASFLVAQRTPDFKIKTLSQAVRYGVPVCVYGGSNQDELLTVNYSDVMLVRKETERKVFEGLLDGDCRVAVAPVNAYSMYVRSPLNQNCTIQSEKRVIEILTGGFATAVDTGTLCTSLIDNVVDLYMTQMKADGFMDEVWNTHLMKVGDTSCLAEGDLPDVGNSATRVVDNEDSDTVSLNLEEMAGIFILHGIAATLAMIVALVRFFLVKRKDPGEMMERLGLKEEGDGEVGATEEEVAGEEPTRTTNPSHISGPNEFWEEQRQNQMDAV